MFYKNMEKKIKYIRHSDILQFVFSLFSYIFFSLLLYDNIYVGDVVFASLPDPGEDVSIQGECGALGKDMCNDHKS